MTQITPILDAALEFIKAPELKKTESGYTSTPCCEIRVSRALGEVLIDILRNSIKALSYSDQIYIVHGDDNEFIFRFVWNGDDYTLEITEVSGEYFTDVEPPLRVIEEFWQELYKSCEICITDFNGLGGRWTIVKNAADNHIAHAYVRALSIKEPASYPCLVAADAYGYEHSLKPVFSLVALKRAVSEITA